MIQHSSSSLSILHHSSSSSQSLKLPQYRSRSSPASSSFFLLLLFIFLTSSLLFSHLTCHCEGIPIADCCCELETIDLGNDAALHSTLVQLRNYTFFRIFKVNLNHECPFWRESHQCSRINCAVCGECSNEDVPEPWRIPTTDPVDRTLGGEVKTWKDRDETMWIVQDSENDDTQGEGASYINMQLNPEGYTGYEGFAPHRIWSAIYEENCFHMGAIQPAAETSTSSSSSSSSFPSSKAPSAGFGGMGGGKKAGGGNGGFVAKSSPPKNLTPPQQESGIMHPLPPPKHSSEYELLCFEQRVLYRLLSGLHASISTHIANSYPIGQVDPHIDIHSSAATGLIGPNTTVYQQRVGAFPDRVNNLYFTFVFMLRSINKAREILRGYDYNTGNVQEDIELRKKVNSFLDSHLVNSCSSQASFDETVMFKTSSATAPNLKNQLKNAFRNISRIMDCVGCEKCRLHGKLQILGIGTALKILFEDETKLKLERNEVMALVVTTAKLSHSLRVAHQMEERMRKEKLSGVAGVDGSNITTTGNTALASIENMSSRSILTLGVTILIGFVSLCTYFIWRIQVLMKARTRAASSTSSPISREKS